VCKKNEYDHLFEIAVSLGDIFLLYFLRDCSDKMSIYRNQNAGTSGGAEHLARIHGTEEDKVNCPFYFKIGACRHGDKCSR